MAEKLKLYFAGTTKTFSEPRKATETHLNRSTSTTRWWRNVSNTNFWQQVMPSLSFLACTPVQTLFRQLSLHPFSSSSSSSSGLLVEVRERWTGSVKAAHRLPSKVNPWVWLAVNLPFPTGAAVITGLVWSLSLFSSVSLSQASAFLTFLYTAWSKPGPPSAAPTSPHRSKSCLGVYNNTSIERN